MEKQLVVNHPDFYYVFTTIDDYIMPRYAELCGFNIEFTETVSTAKHGKIRHNTAKQGDMNQCTEFYLSATATSVVHRWQSI